MLTPEIKQTKQPEQTAGKSPSVTWKAISIAIILIPISCYRLVQVELVQYSALPTTVSLIFTVVFSVFVLTLLKRFLPGMAFHS